MSLHDAAPPHTMLDGYAGFDARPTEGLPSTAVEAAAAVDLPPVARPAGRRARHRTPESQAEFRGELLAYAKQRYREAGYEAVSIRAVTDAFGMSPMSFYGYFDSKLDLVKHILLDAFGALLDHLRQAGDEAASPEACLAAHLRALIDYWEARPDQYRLAYVSSLDSRDAGLRLEDEPVYRELVTLVHERIRACAGASPVPEALLCRLQHVISAQALGFLHLTLAVQRAEAEHAGDLKELLVAQAIETVRTALATAPDRPAV